MKNKYLIALFLISIVLISCYTPVYIYSAAPPNNPYFREKGESKLAAYYSTASDENDLENEYNDGLDLQAAYAVSDHWALTADYYKRNEKNVVRNDGRSSVSSSVIRYDRHLSNFGAGYFMPITNDKQITLNIFGGLGFGKFSFTENGVDPGGNFSHYYNSNMAKWYIQPSINFLGKYIRTGLIGKISWVHYDNATTTILPTSVEYFDLQSLSGNTLSYFEGTWNIQGTFKQINRVYIDGGLTFCSEPIESISLRARNWNASIGLSIDLSKMKKLHK